MQFLRAAALVLSVSTAAHAGQFELLSTAGIESGTAEGATSANTPPAISADGRWIAFVSTALNLVTGQQGTDPVHNVFLHDRQSGTTVLVSHAAGSPALAGDYNSLSPSISADGRWVAYQSHAGNLVPGQDGDPVSQAFLYDRDTGTNTLVSHSTAGPSVETDGVARYVRVSADGSRVAFVSNGGDLVPGQVQTSASYNVFLFERATGEITLVSRAAGTGATTTHGENPSLSADGRWVAFESSATNLIPGFSQNFLDPVNVFLFDRVAGSMTLVSRTSASATNGAGGSNASVSADGSAVAFVSRASNLVAGQTDPGSSFDAFLFDRAAGTNVLVSRSASSATTAGNGAVATEAPRISADGLYVSFNGHATNAVPGQVDTPFTHDVFLFERATSSLTLVSHTSSSAVTATGNRSERPSLSAAGRYVAFNSLADNLVPGQVGPQHAFEWNVFLFDRTTGSNVLVSGAGGSGQVTAGSTGDAALSADGAVLAFASAADDLVAGTADLNQDPDLFLYDVQAAASTVATLHAPGMASASAAEPSYLASASADGRYAVFQSRSENVVPGQTGTGWTNVFLLDRETGAKSLVSRSAASATSGGNSESWSALVSADGAWVVFNSLATDLVPGQVDSAGTPDVFLYERATGTVILVSRAGTAVTTGNAGCGTSSPNTGYQPAPMAISADGRYVAFACQATNLVAGQTDANSFGPDVYLYDRVAGQTSLVSRSAASALTTGNGPANRPAMSPDGRYIAFTSGATDLVAGVTDANGDWDVFLHDRVTGQTVLASRAAGTLASANAESRFPALSANGRFVAFDSDATDLVPGQTDPVRGPGVEEDVFLFDRDTGVVELISRMAGSATAAGNARSSNALLSADGRYVLFASRASNLVPSQVETSAGPTIDLFVHDRVTRTMELISHSASSPVWAGNDDTVFYAFSPNGRFVAFASEAANLAPGPSRAVFLADRQLHTLERVAGSGNPMSMPALSDDGTVFFASPDPDLVEADYNNALDVFAYVRTTEPAGSDYFTLTPCRLLDTRLPQDGPALTSDEPALLTAPGACGIPETATALALVVTVTQPAERGRLTVHPGNLQASTSTLNFAAGETRSNNAIVPLAFNGERTLGITPFVLGGGTVHVIVDVFGWFE